jgi:CMP-N,N'-diacetyllegionaminic acid synthase
MKMNVVGLIPARGGSKGIPRKNVKMLAGKPLIAHTIEQSLAAVEISRTVVTSEDDEILEVARRWGAETLRRPFEHATDSAGVDPMLIWCIQALEARGPKVDVLVLLYPTAPLRRVDDIDQTVRRVVADGCDSALTLCEDSSYLWRVDGAIASPVNYDPRRRKPRQLEGWNQWVENKAVYAMRRDLIMETGCRLGGKIGWVEMPAQNSVDLDTPDDWKLAEALMSPSTVRV